MSETIFVSKHLIARHAGSALWLARYMERIENLARLLDVTKTFAGQQHDLSVRPRSRSIRQRQP